MLPCGLTLPRFGDGDTSRPRPVPTATPPVDRDRRGSGGRCTVRRRVAAAVVVLVTAALWRSVRRFEVTGSSMAPALLAGDRLVVVGLPWLPQPWPEPGAVIAVRDPRLPSRILIKRVAAVDRRHGTLEVVGDRRAASTDSRTFGPVSTILGRRSGGLPIRPCRAERPCTLAGGVRSGVMPSLRDDLDRILTGPYLDGIDNRSLDDIRAMRTECQQAEVALSYLRRLIQGRLDIVHAYLEHAGSDAPPDLATLVDDLPGILSAGPGRPPGPEHLPMLIAPDTEEADLTAELDAVLGADEIAALVGRDRRAAPGVGRPARIPREQGVARTAGAARPHRHAAGRAGGPAQDGTGLGRRSAVVKDPIRTEGTQFVKELPERFNELGSFIREQRSSARLSLRRLSELAGISNPYLSQIERGLRRPSAEILQQIAKALRISAETLYVQAGILDKPDGDTDLSRHIFADRHLTEEQRQAMMRIYLSFRHENADQAEGHRVSAGGDQGDGEPTDALVAAVGPDGTTVIPGGSGPAAAVG